MKDKVARTEKISEEFYRVCLRAMLNALEFIPLTVLCKKPFTLSSLSCQLFSGVFVGIGVQLYVHYQTCSILHYTYNVSCFMISSSLKMT